MNDCQVTVPESCVLGNPGRHEVSPILHRCHIGGRYRFKHALEYLRGLPSIVINREQANILLEANRSLASATVAGPFPWVLNLEMLFRSPSCDTHLYKVRLEISPPFNIARSPSHPYKTGNTSY